MGILVKICGINSAEAADAAVRAGTDLAGLVFNAKSPRNLRPDQASMLAARMRGRVRLAIVLSDPTDEALDAAVAAVAPDFIQLHGSETTARVAVIRARFGTSIIKAIPIAEPSDLAGIWRFEDSADMLLFDAKPPSGVAREGGHGAAFDWQILRDRKFARPWLLAGGLNAENVARAMRICEAPGVDGSSGVETALGQKSPELIAQFVAAARNAQFANAAEERPRV